MLRSKGIEQKRKRNANQKLGARQRRLPGNKNNQTRKTGRRSSAISRNNSWKHFPQRDLWPYSKHFGVNAHVIIHKN